MDLKNFPNFLSAIIARTVQPALRAKSYMRAIKATPTSEGSVNHNGSAVK